MNPEGSLRITLHWDGRRIVRAGVHPRPLAPIESLLRGKLPEEALRILPMLFSLCGKAQAAACATALEAATERALPVIPLRRERLVLVEAVQELLWRFLIDFPRLLDKPGDPALLARIRHALSVACMEPDERGWQEAIRRVETVVRAALPSEDLDNADMLIAQLLHICRKEHRWGHSAVALMPDSADIPAVLVPGLLARADFPAFPQWKGAPVETGSLARMHRHPAVAASLSIQGTSIFSRVLARLVEINDLFVRLQAEDAGPRPWVQGAAIAGGGLAWVQNARGLLVHYAALDEAGRIAAYKIIAPTEWNFHPSGAFTQGLAGKAADSAEAARRHAELLALSLDPCVTHQIEVEHA
ncbi:hypothetical protein [Noviherbaspirillum denitrificans]|uniref:Hydrogenase expression/formation protein HupK n=1 Tax=Noviherbaspirillum denitrificans TaxID=1968433 RepID=A0A254T7T1_9BURK|nr:hypothetical protein [Noviherbaspirillum denitrificans]OWW18706.1 hypothetical protein AYR66_03800 [Noviherbaspirillum denitrificans]